MYFLMSEYHSIDLTKNDFYYMTNVPYSEVIMFFEVFGCFLWIAVLILAIWRNDAGKWFSDIFENDKQVENPVARMGMMMLCLLTIAILISIASAVVSFLVWALDILERIMWGPLTLLFG